ncbi:RagB/SusD family nutrient uptake outer membrane protein [Chitinophaga sancti]|uniref:RagB/SusD family nutrient uptake outer membrane protein n=1 Tax=Chitinophaga sancti TaxID=1004 RepID=A0A1K1NA01_9BACT|nr:RagB/SusD family nutrient uptake outer membrane protein [Chitinophaga sancti]WQD63427.1 RagB/SusD family nutrient uptake outer membrane protein [Chitinophaga sancti]WQG90947.1 RagB/SusD family nutrient uptake outer membrane protein [Chitinophaga sancti]SFW32187.1 Starch-binding associating with outer membrane [Chitinophaga sancti]
MKKVILIIAAVGMLFVSACKKQLEETSYSFISPDDFYTSGDDAVTAVNGIYSELYTYDLYTQPFWNLTLLDDDHVSGADWYLGYAGAGNPSTYWGIDRPWSGLYLMISRANTVLEKVPGIASSAITNDLRSRVMGEAWFLRGWAYFQLVQLYGGVPLRMHSLSADPNQNIPRSSVKAVYDTIVSDLKRAEASLFYATDSRSGQTGRVNKGVAQGFLAKVYLTMGSGSLSGNIAVRGGQDNAYYSYTKNVVAGYDSLNSKACYTLARDKALELIQAGQYSLFDNWAAIWTKANRNGKEHLWEIQSLAGSSFVNDLHSYFTAGSYNFGLGAVWMTNNHYKNYEEGLDTRVVDGVTHQYTAYRKTSAGTNYYYPSWESAKYSKDANGNSYYNNGGTDNKAFVNKFSDVSDPAVSTSDAFFPVMRYSEVLLMYAEAENEVNGGPDASAYQYLNQVRQRSKATTAPTGLTQEEFRSFVLEERGREFSLENIRRYDLIRWGVYLQVMNKISLGQDNISKVRTNKNLLLPIPTSELSSNSAITSNNPGW